MSHSSKSPKISLAQEREILLRRSMLLREQIAGNARQLAPKARAVDSTFNAIGWVKANPGIVLGVAGSMLLLRPRKTVRLGVKAWGAWRLFSKVMPVVRIINRLR